MEEQTSVEQKPMDEKPQKSKKKKLSKKQKGWSIAGSVVGGLFTIILILYFVLT